LTAKIISCAIEVHSVLGPGLLESAYEKCLCHEFAVRKMNFQRQKPLPIVYKGINLSCSYRLDVVIENKGVVELKSVDSVMENTQSAAINLSEAFEHPNRTSIQFFSKIPEGWNSSAPTLKSPRLRGE
jgi:GxxExxY protein